jgi:hypothetical protein
MNQELGKIEKMPVDSYKQGRKIFFVPVLYAGEDAPEEYSKKLKTYWEQVIQQINELASKLGAINHIYHELIAVAGEEGVATLKDLNASSYQAVKACLDKKASLEAFEDADILTEFMDWSRCLLVGLQNAKVVTKIYEFYTETDKKRTESLAHKLDETLKDNEIGLVLMRENHQVQFPPDIQVFYVSPPALDDIKRWIREREKTAGEKEKDKKEEK